MEFIQEGIATLHEFGEVTTSVALDDVGVIVPLSEDDVGERGVHHTFEILAGLNPGEVIVPLRADRATAKAVDSWLQASDVSGTVLWCNGPPMTRLLDRAGVSTGGGKGLDVWLGLGLGATDHEKLVVHDADSRAYAHEHVPRLAWPLNHGFDFTKGYYARIEDGRLYGRLVRLLWEPLLAAIGRTQSHPVIEYLDSFRYPLAGEFAVSSEIARQLRLHPGWGLEVGMLGETFTNAGPRQTAQVDLGRHQHDHRPVDGPSGLAAMAEAVSAALFAVLEMHGLSVDEDSIEARYERIARDYIERYAVDAAFNGLTYDATAERAQVTRYRQAIGQGSAPPWLPAFADTPLAAEELREAGRARHAAMPDRHEA